MIRLRTAAALVATALLFTACSDSGPSADDYAAAIADTLDEDRDLGLSAAEKDCVATAAVEAVGVDRLEEEGTPEEVAAETDDDLTSLNLDDDVLTDIADGYLDCVDDLSDRFVEFLVEADESFDEDCLADAIDERTLRTIVAEGLDARTETLEEAVTPCAGPGAVDYATAIAATIDEEGQLGLTDDERTCIATTAVEIIGLDTLREFGTPDEVTAATEDDLTALGPTSGQLDEIAAGYLGCVPDVTERFITALVTTDQVFVDEACLRASVDDATTEVIIAETLAGETDTVDEVVGPCLIEDDPAVEAAILELVDAGFTRDVAECVVVNAVFELGPQILDESYEGTDDEVARIEEIIEECGA